MWPWEIMYVPSAGWAVTVAIQGESTCTVHQCACLHVCKRVCTCLWKRGSTGEICAFYSDEIQFCFCSGILTPPPNILEKNIQTPTLNSTLSKSGDSSPAVHVMGEVRVTRVDQP